MNEGGELQTVLKNTFAALDAVLEKQEPGLNARQVGTITFVGEGIATVSGLPDAKAEELLRFPRGLLGMAFNLDADEIGVILLAESEELEAGYEVRLTGRVLDVPVGDAMLGRVVDATGRPLDDAGPVQAAERRPIECEAPPIMNRAPVTVPLQTGIKVVDALIPIGRGQRELILGDRQTGKTAIAMDTIINQHDKNVVCVYCSCGQRSSSLARVISDFREHDAMAYCTVVAATGDDPPGQRYICPYAATTIAEYFMEQGRDVLIVYDELTAHARAYRELSLLLRRPPGREAFPGDIFYIHSRLLERSTHLKDELGGGSLTALPIIATEAQNISAFIPTNLISITDGQIYLSPDLFQKGVLPGVDVGKSVSRVGGKAQLPAYRAVSGSLRLSYAQYQELETFARFGTRLDEETVKRLERGRRVREILKQVQYEPIPVEEQIAVLLAVTEGVFDDIPIESVKAAEHAIRDAVRIEHSDISNRIREGAKLSDADRAALVEMCRDAVKRPAGTEEGKASVEQKNGNAGNTQGEDQDR